MIHVVWVVHSKSPQVAKIAMVTDGSMHTFIFIARIKATSAWVSVGVLPAQVSKKIYSLPNTKRTPRPRRWLVSQLMCETHNPAVAGDESEINWKCGTTAEVPVIGLKQCLADLSRWPTVSCFGHQYTQVYQCDEFRGCRLCRSLYRDAHRQWVRFFGTPCILAQYGSVQHLSADYNNDMSLQGVHTNCIFSHPAFFSNYLSDLAKIWHVNSKNRARQEFDVIYDEFEMDLK